MTPTYPHSLQPDHGQKSNRTGPGRLGRLAHFTVRYRWPVIAAWVVLTLVGGVAAGKLSTRWYQSTAVPGKSAYQGSLRTLKALGVGQRPPNIVVFHSTSVERHEEPGCPRGNGTRGESEPQRAHELVLLDRQRDVRIARPAHHVPAGLPAREQMLSM